MRTPRSQLVRDQIRGLAFTAKNRTYVDELLMIEEFVIHAPRGMCGGMLDQRLRADHRAEYLAILRELNPSGYRREIREREEAAREARGEERQAAAAARHMDARDRAAWAALGGKVSPR